MHERSLISVKVEPRSTSRLSSELFILPLFYFTGLKFTCINVCSQKCVSGNQPLANGWAYIQGCFKVGFYIILN